MPDEGALERASENLFAPLIGPARCGLRQVLRFDTRGRAAARPPSSCTMSGPSSCVLDERRWRAIHNARRLTVADAASALVSAGKVAGAGLPRGAGDSVERDGVTDGGDCQHCTDRLTWDMPSHSLCIMPS